MRQKETDAELGAGRGIGQHAGPVVFAQHHQDARPHQQPDQTQTREATARAGVENTGAVVRTIDVLVRDHDFGLDRRSGEQIHFAVPSSIANRQLD